MKSLKSTVIAFAFAAVVGLTFLTVTRTPAVQAQRQNGYWVQLARNATVREYPGGPTIVRGGRAVELKAGQWFHIDPGVGTKAWGLGYCCVGGGRGCNRHNSVPGYVLRSALSNQTASHAGQAAEPEVSAASSAPASFTPGAGVGYSYALSVAPYAGVGAPFRGHERRICAREAWFRNDRLHRIGILRAGDRVYVDRYTDGSKEDGQRRWAIGRGVGPGITPGRNYGRVLVESLCP